MTVAISFTGTEVEAFVEDVEYKHFVTTQPIEIELGETAGHPVTTETSHFAVARLVTETDELEQAMGAPETLDEVSVFISNEDGELGAGLFRIEEGSIDDALDKFEADYLEE